MRKFFGYMLVGLCFLISWPAHLAAYGYGIYYIVKTFLDDGIGAGILSIFVVGIGLWFVEMVIGLVTVPLGALGVSLVEGAERRLEISEVELEREITRPRRTRKTTAGGILMIITGLIALMLGTDAITIATPIHSLPVVGMSGLIIILGVLPLIGGIVALTRRKWGLALAGSIVAILWLWFLGIPALIFIAMGKREFEQARYAALPQMMERNYVGNMKTRIFHYTNCYRAEQIDYENAVWFESSEDAIIDGYQPCKLCNPE